MLRFAKVATPLTGLPIAVPESAPPPGLDPMASVTRLAAVVTTRPEASWIPTCTAGVICAPAVAAAAWPWVARGSRADAARCKFGVHGHPTQESPGEIRATRRR